MMKSTWIALTLALSLAAQVKAQDEVQISEKDYVLGNTLLTLLHEVGHALVDVWQLPVLGREEDAVDAFSVTYILGKFQTDETLTDGQIAQLDTYLYSTADSWLTYADETDLDDRSIYAAEHSLDLQRFYAHLCLLVGYDEDFYSEWLTDFEAEDEIDPEACIETSELAAENWLYLLAEERGEDWPDLGDKGITIGINPGANQAQQTYVKWLKDWDWLAYFEQHLETDLKLPSALKVRFKSCGEANAWYAPDEQRVTMCYELMEEMASFYQLGSD